MEKTKTSLSKILFPEEHVSNAIIDLLDQEIGDAKKLQDDAILRFEQSKHELNYALHRNIAVMAQIQKMQMDLDGISKPDLQQAYATALDSQQKLLDIRGLVEKLKSETATLSNTVEFLQKIRGMIKSPGDTNFDYDIKDSAAALELVIDAQETERQNLSRKIHDGPAQVLSNLIIQAEITQKYFDLDQNRARQELAILKSTVVGTFQKMRDYIYELRPMMLDDLGFFPTVKRYVETYREQTKTDIRINIFGKEKRLESYLETMLFRIVQELLKNAVQHNKEKLQLLRIEVNIVINNQNLAIDVQDNGKGFTSTILSNNNGIGLKLIRERIEMMNGKFDIESSTDQGCKISLQIPYLEADVKTNNASISEGIIR